ncbi:MAG: helix-turn-helix domain-containing protein [Clostridia bacterium]|nr:helix-turn-helix domain-containing protein [Clostridia bacterium]
MKFSTLIDELDLGQEAWRIRGNPGVEIHSYAPLSPNAAPETDMVYVCEADRLPAPLPAGMSCLCAGRLAGEPSGESGCNLVETERPFFELLSEVARLMHAEQKLMSDMQQLLEILQAGGGLQAIVDRMNRMSPNPIIIVDSGYKILAMTRAPIEERPDLEMQRALGHMIDRNIDSLRREFVYERTRAQQYPYYSVDPNTGYGWITCLVNVYGVEAAQIGIMELYHEFSRYDYELSNYLCKLVSLELSKDDFYRRNHAVMHSAFLADLLAERVRDTRTAEARARQLGWDLSEQMYALTIFDRNFGAFDRRAQLISEQLHGMLPESRYVVYESRIVFLLPTKKAYEILFSEERPFEEYLRNNHLSAGLSDRFSGLLGLRRHYLQSLKAAELGGTLEPEAALHRYGDLACQHIGSLLSEKQPLQDFYHPVVAAIARADELGGTALIPTLRAYLKHPDEPARAAAELFIHKNTLFYRMNKMRQHFGLDLSRGSERLRVQLTLAFMELG